MGGKAAAVKTQTPRPRISVERSRWPDCSPPQASCPKSAREGGGGPGEAAPATWSREDRQLGHRPAVETHSSSPAFPIKPSGGLHSDKTMWLAKTKKCF